MNSQSVNDDPIPPANTASVKRIQPVFISLTSLRRLRIVLGLAYRVGCRDLPSSGFLAEHANPFALPHRPDGRNIHSSREFLSMGDSLFSDLVCDQAGVIREGHEPHIFHKVLNEP